MNARDWVLRWTEQSHIRPENIERALSVAGVLPDRAAWRRFLDRLFLWLGALMLAAALIFFFAYNWDALGRYARFALAEGALILAVGVAWKLGFDRRTGQVALFVAALSVGALLALVGQTYQTGADPWELFAVWALAILPWCAIGRLSALWLLWLALLNLSLAAYYTALGSFFGWMFDAEALLWLLLALNVTALLSWELAAARREWMRQAWGRRLIATVVAMHLSALGLWAIFEWRPHSVAALLIWLALSVAGAYRYRFRQPDLYILAVGALTGIVIVTGAVGKVVIDGMDAEAGGFLLTALVVIGISAAAAHWLRVVAGEMNT